MRGTWRRWMGLGLGLGIALGVAGTASTVSAQGTEEDVRARGHFAAASSYFEEGDYETALREFQRAYDLSHRAQLLYNLGLAYERLGRHAEAAQALQGYLDGVTDIENRAALARRVENLRRRAVQDAAAAGSGTSSTPGTGSESGTGSEAPTGTGSEAPTGTGSATGTGSEATAGSATGTGSEAPTGTGSEAPTGTVSATGTGSEATPGSGSGTGSAPVDGGGDAAPASEGGTPVGAITAFAVGGAGLGLLAVGGLLAMNEYAARDAGCGMEPGRCTDAQVSDLRTFTLLADVGLGVGIAGVAAGVVFLATGAGNVGGGAQASVVARPRVVALPRLVALPWASNDGAGVTVGGVL